MCSIRGRLLVIASLVQLLALIFAIPASAHLSFQGNIWGYETNPMTLTVSDPVNLIFTSKFGGYSATYGTVLTDFNSITAGAWGNTQGSSMDFMDHGLPLTMNWQRATNCTLPYDPLCNRQHTRARQGYDRDTTSYGTYTLMSAHYEHFVLSCMNHSVQYFNQERDNITGAFAYGGYAYSSPGWTITGRPLYWNSCAGQYVSYDNNLNMIWIP